MFGNSIQNIFSVVVFLHGKVLTGRTVVPKLPFVVGRAVVATMESRTGPKVDLQASVLVSQLRPEITRTMNTQIVVTLLWTEATTVLQRLHSSNRQAVLVQIAS